MSINKDKILILIESLIFVKIFKSIELCGYRFLENSNYEIMIIYAISSTEQGHRLSYKK